MNNCMVKKNVWERVPLWPLFAGCILYMECILRVITCDRFFHKGLIFVLLFSVAAGCFFAGAAYFFEQTGRRILTGILFVVLFLFYALQIGYHLMFGKYLIWFSLYSGGMEQVLTGPVLDNTMIAAQNALPYLVVLLFGPILCYILFLKIWPVKRRWKRGILHIAVSVGLYCLSITAISVVPQLKEIQNGMFDMNAGVKQFGLLYAQSLDIKYNFLGIPQDIALIEEPLSVPEADTEDETEVVEVEEQIDYSPNVQNIDFQKLLQTDKNGERKKLHEYFASKTPTDKNEYTGMYEGYNLIHIVAEGFSPYAIDPVLTPTLYKMQQEGFSFENFYTPIWGVSTSDGEYTACTGLLPKPGVWSFYKSADNYMPYCLGNMFESIGVEETYAYHNNSYTYYHRDQSHPNMGYVFKGMGNGVEQYVKKVWPQSDYEMIAGSVADYVSADKQFHAYYMTVSGHLEYTKMDNTMAYRNWDAVEELSCSHNLKAYYACNIEFDKAMEHLLAVLNEAGVADKTVISITPDHYPYGLEKTGNSKYEIWEEILGHKVDTQFELYKSCFLLYCQGTKDAPVVEKYCYSADILPTLLNLFGFSYDSRLLAGSDILSDTEGLVVFQDGSYLTDFGAYTSSENKFVVFDSNLNWNQDQMDQYKESVKTKVNTLLKVSAQILDTDYYRFVFQ